MANINNLGLRARFASAKNEYFAERSKSGRNVPLPNDLIDVSTSLVLINCKLLIKDNEFK